MTLNKNECTTETTETLAWNSFEFAKVLRDNYLKNTGSKATMSAIGIRYECKLMTSMLQQALD